MAKSKAPTAGEKNGKRALIEGANARMFIVVLIAAVIVSASLVVSKILLSQRSYQARVISAKEKARDQLKDNIDTAKDLKKSFVALESSDVNSQLILDALPSKYDYPALATSIEKFAALGGHRIEEFAGTDESGEAEKSSVSPSPHEMQFSLKSTSDYAGTKKLLLDLERSIRPFSVRTITLSGSGEELTASMEVVTYYQPAYKLEIGKEKVK